MTVPFTCPECRSSQQSPLESLSRIAYVFYFRCDACGCVWVIDKEKLESRPEVVMPGIRSSDGDRKNRPA